jgi:hypothetical protein
MLDCNTLQKGVIATQSQQVPVSAAVLRIAACCAADAALATYACHGLFSDHIMHIYGNVDRLRCVVLPAGARSGAAA